MWRVKVCFRWKAKNKSRITIWRLSEYIPAYYFIISIWNACGMLAYFFHWNSNLILFTKCTLSTNTHTVTQINTNANKEISHMVFTLIITWRLITFMEFCLFLLLFFLFSLISVDVWCVYFFTLFFLFIHSRSPTSLCHF